MKLFVYSMREYDELAFFEKFCGEYGVEFGYTTQTPCLENVELAKGYDVVDIITTIMDKPMIDAFHAAGIRCISSRTIGYDHIDTEYAHTLGMGCDSCNLQSGECSGLYHYVNADGVP